MKNDFFLVGPLVSMRINWLKTKFLMLNFGKQSLKLIPVFFVTVVYLFVIFFNQNLPFADMQTCCLSFTKFLRKDMELPVNEI